MRVSVTAGSHRQGSGARHGRGCAIELSDPALTRALVRYVCFCSLACPSPCPSPSRSASLFCSASMPTTTTPCSAIAPSTPCRRPRPCSRSAWRSTRDCRLCKPNDTQAPRVRSLYRYHMSSVIHCFIHKTLFQLTCTRPSPVCSRACARQIDRKCRKLLHTYLLNVSATASKLRRMRMAVRAGS